MSFPDSIMYAPVASGLLLIMLAFSVWVFFHEELMTKWALNPFDMVRHKEYYRFLSSGFIHGNPLHLMMNMTAFALFGFHLEPRLGHWQFGVLYLCSLLLSDLINVIRYRDRPSYYSLGASGAVSGVVLSSVACDPYMDLSFLMLIDIPAWTFGLSYILYSIFATYRGSDRVNHLAHLVGAVSGIVLTLLLKPEVGVTLQHWIALR